MDGVRAATRSAVRRPMDPKKELFLWMVIQAASSGFGFAGIVEAHREGHEGWGLVFVALLTCVLYNYFWCAWTWASWWGE